MNLRHILTSLLTVTLFSLMASSCKKDDPDPVKQPAHRTVLVYMASNNSLGTSKRDSADMKEMVKAAAAGDLQGGRLLMYHADTKGNCTLSELTETGFKTLTTYENDGLSSVHAGRMKKVIADTKRIAPAGEYGIILWSHGDGWLADGIADDPDVSPLSFGHENNKKMNISTLAAVLEPEKFKWAYFDCCYMACVEVAYELRHALPVFVASATELPADGMDYTLNIRPLMQKGSADLIQAAANTFSVYDSKAGSDRTCTMSVISTSGMDNLAAKTRAIYENAASPMPEGYSPQKFMTEYRCWHFDFADYVKALCGGETEQYLDWKKTLDKCVLYKANTPYIWSIVKLNHHSGLSTYIIAEDGDETRRNYDTTPWFKDVASCLVD